MLTDHQSHTLATRLISVLGLHGNRDLEGLSYLFRMRTLGVRVRARCCRLVDFAGQNARMPPGPGRRHPTARHLVGIRHPEPHVWNMPDVRNWVVWLASSRCVCHTVATTSLSTSTSRILKEAEQVLHTGEMPFSATPQLQANSSKCKGQGA